MRLPLKQRCRLIMNWLELETKRPRIVFFAGSEEAMIFRRVIASPKILIFTVFCCALL